jgi:hypothetical protein
MPKTALTFGSLGAAAAVALALATGGSQHPPLGPASYKTSVGRDHYAVADYWPKKYTGVGLKADSNEVAVEGITLSGGES